MSTTALAPDSEQGKKATPRASNAKPQRVLACVLCQQRKVKCNREFPCKNCIQAGVQCVPANSLPQRPRRRRFPEGKLLERLRYYEGLLRQNNISFDPLHPPAAGEDMGWSPSARDAQSKVSGKTPANSKEAVDLWQAISRVTLDAEDLDEEGDADDNTSTLSPNDHILVRHGDDAAKTPSTYRIQMEGTSLFNDHLLFAPLNLDVNLSPSHPEQVQIFRLWQIYMDNVNPLLKVTHTPTLQPRIIDAASDVANISPALEALMLSIYCISVVSLDEGGCIRLFRSPRNQLLAGYQSACQQALLKCSLWRSCDVDGLTALYLYLVSVAGQTDARCLACMLVVAMRIAQRMGIHNESTNTECTVLEAEMRRRLWWSLVAFDYRISELTDYKTTTLIPTWDCSTPLNVNDFELRPDMKKAPVVHEKPTEALFCVVRSELADFVRHSPFHLDFVNPSLNSIAQPKATFHGPSTGGGELVALGKLVEDKYLAFCDVEDQLHYMTIWTTRGSLARSRLLDHYSKLSKSSVPETDAQRSAGISYALSMLECDMKLRTSPLTKGYLWFVGFYLPALAYLYTLNHLRKWPDSDHSAKAWAAIGENYEALTMNQKRYEQSERGIYVHKFSQVVLQAWEARETLLKQQHKPLEPVPQIVLDVRNRITESSFFPFPGHGSALEADNGVVGMNNIHHSPMSTMPENFGADHGIGVGHAFTNQVPVAHCQDDPGQATMDIDMSQFWTEGDWRWMHTQRS